MSSHPIHQYADAASAQVRGLSSEDCHLTIRQRPEHAKVAIGGKEKDRKPIDPPPIIQLQISRNRDAGEAFLQSPYFFMTANLLKDGESGALPTNVNTSLAGTLVSSLHRLKDINNADAGFFVFSDLSVKVEGTYRLEFHLYEMRHATTTLEAPLATSNPLCQSLISQPMEVCHITAIRSDEFIVYSAKNWPGMGESTALTRSFSDQGVRLRLRKEPRALLRKRGPASDDYQPMHYRSKVGRSDSTSVDTRSDSMKRTDSPRNDSEFQHPAEARSLMRPGGESSTFQHPYNSQQTGNLMPQRPGSLPKFEGSQDGGEMSHPFNPRFQNPMPRLPTSYQDNVNMSPMSVVNRADELGGNLGRRGSNISQLRQASSDSSLHSQNQSQAPPGIPFSGVPTHNYSLPSSNRTSISDYSGAYTHQPPQPFQPNYPQHNHSRSQTSLNSQSPATSRSTPQSYYGFDHGSRDSNAGMGESGFTSPDESPEVQRRAGNYMNWGVENGFERVTLPNRPHEPTNPAAFPNPFAQRNGNYGQPVRTSRTISPTQAQGLGIAGHVYSPNSYMPPPHMGQSNNTPYLPPPPPITPLGTGTPGSVAPDSSGLSSATGVGEYFKPQ